MNSQDSALSGETFGHQLKRYFHIDPSIIHLNAGEYGMTPKAVIESKLNYYTMMEKNSDVFVRHLQTDLIEDTKNLVSNAIQADKEGIVFVENSVEALHTCLRSICETRGKGLLYFDFLNSETKNICHYIADYFEIKSKEIPTSQEILNSDEKLLAAIKQCIQDGDFQIAIMEHISVLGLILPIKEIIKICQESNILCLVDGTQAYGQIELNITHLDPGKIFN
jgi:selenocysteine lyase/cysteine desulfurase